jgi:uncharacterized membrane protein (DUF106 family)
VLLWPPYAQVHPVAAQQIGEMFKRMQAYYEGQVSATKQHSLSVLKEMQQQQQR